MLRKFTCVMKITMELFSWIIFSFVEVAWLLDWNFFIKLFEYFYPMGNFDSEILNEDKFFSHRTIASCRNIIFYTYAECLENNRSLFTRQSGNSYQIWISYKYNACIEKIIIIFLNGISWISFFNFFIMKIAVGDSLLPPSTESLF